MLSMTDLLGFTDMLWKISWQAGILAGIVWIVCRFAKNAPASFRQALWLLVLAKFLLPPLGELPTEWLPQRHVNQPKAVQVRKVARTPEIVPFAGKTSRPPTIPRLSTMVSRVTAPGPFEPVRSKLPAAWPFLIWIMGAGAGIVLLLTRYSAQMGLIRGSSPAGESISLLARECAVRLGIRNYSEPRVSERVRTPMIMGLFRPVILLPSDLPEICGENDLRAMLLHELTHVKRRDMIVLWIYQFAKVIYFFQPAIWLVGHELKKEREFACDETVLNSSLIPRKDYASGYMAALRMANCPSQVSTSLAMAEPLDVEKKRLTAILTGPMRKPSFRLVALLLTVAAVGLPNFTGCSKPGAHISTYRGLAASSWPKYGGGLTNASLSTGNPSPAWRIKWDAKTQDGLTGQPAIGSDGSVYFNVGQEFVYCFDGKTGARKWLVSNVDGAWKRQVTGLIAGKNSAGQVSERHFSVRTSSPALSSDGKLYVGSRDGNMYALDAKTGRRIWRSSARIATASKHGDDTAGPGSPTIGNDGTVIFMCQGICYAVEGLNGAPIWSYDCRSNACGAPAIGGDGTVYALSNDDVYALDPVSGRVRWHFASPKPGGTSGFTGELTVGPDGSVYFCDTKGVLYALDWKTGNAKWQVGLKQPVAQTGPVIGPNGTVYVITVNGALHAVDRSTGRERWTQRYGFQGQALHPAIAVDGTIYLNGLDDKNVRSTVILAIDPKNGLVIRKLSLGGSSNMPPIPPAIAGDGTIYTGSVYGWVYAIQ